MTSNSFPIGFGTQLLSQRVLSTMLWVCLWEYLVIFPEVQLWCWTKNPPCSFCSRSSRKSSFRFKLGLVAGPVMFFHTKVMISVFVDLLGAVVQSCWNRKIPSEKVSYKVVRMKLPNINIKIPKYSEFLSLKLKMILVKNNTTPQFSLHQTSHLTPSIQSYMALSEFVCM